MCRQRRQNCKVKVPSICHRAIFVLLLSCVSNGICENDASAVAGIAGSHDNSGHSNSVKKDLKVNANASNLVESEKTQMEKQTADAVAAKLAQADANNAMPTATAMPQHTLAANGQVQVEETGFKQMLYHPDADISESYKSGFYFFLGLSGAGIALIMFKIYRMRLSRAERKYGVQGDRSNQELTPLPVSIDDGNSDEEDQTLFEINRQQIRIL